MTHFTSCSSYNVLVSRNGVPTRGKGRSAVALYEFLVCLDEDCAERGRCDPLI